MNTKEFETLYLAHEPDIIAILNSKRIYDDDLLHDTYIALFEHSPHPAPEDFVTTFVAFYTNTKSWQDQQESHLVHYDNAQLAALDISDESVGEEALDDHLDNNNRTTYREQSIERLHEIIDYYFAHPQPGERNRRRACRILRLYRQGLSECEISRELKISQPTVHQYLERIIERLKAIALILYNRGANLPTVPRPECASGSNGGKTRF